MDFLATLEKLEKVENEKELEKSNFPFTVYGVGMADECQLSSKPTSVLELQAKLGPLSFIDIKDELSRQYLQPKRMTSSIVNNSQRFIEKKANLLGLIHTENPSMVKRTFKFKRDLLTGEMDISRFEENMNYAHEINAQNSTSMYREPAPSSSFVRGKSNFQPFQPGGFAMLEKGNDNQAKDVQLIEPEHLLVVPPGLTRGIDFTFNSTMDKGLFTETLFLTPDAPKVDDHQEERVVLTKENNEIINQEIKEEIDSFLPDSDYVVPRGIQVKKSRKEWVHVLDVNLDFPEFYDLVPEMAINFPFELDTFQKRAVYHLENSDSVFIAAHTSAGKTVVAEYAIALASKHMTRAIYTSPIKALSNQKYRDFKEKFEDVGILTGDIQIKPDAGCLIMTTEILRSMLYRGADLIRDVEFVIFDEVHYLNDAERGVVWEEVIIMLPDHITLILLSATVPNTKEFAEWVGRTKGKDIYVISTSKRPVPLEHYLFAGRETFPLVDYNKTFNPSGYKAAREVFYPPEKKEYNSDKRSTKDRSNRGQQNKPNFKVGGDRGHFNSSSSDKNMYVNLISYLKKRDLLPCIVFAFSKKKCEEYAGALTNLDLTSGSAEKAKIHTFIQNSLSCLNGTDKELPQIVRLSELLSRGIAVHHSGLLPILKEIVEILFTRGLVKVLFATETFAMGVNAPAKTVVFAMIRKHDGSNFRHLLPGEYTQMAGRAGRRGLDTTGMVIIACSSDVPDEFDLRTMILGKATKLESQFRVTYNMILNLLRVEAIKVEDMIKRSFSENATQKTLPDQEKEHLENVKKMSKLEKLDCTICSPDIGLFYDISYRALTIGYEMQEKIMRSPVGIKAIATGRIVLVNNQMYRNSIGVIVKGVSGSLIHKASNAKRDVSSGSALGQYSLSSKDEKSYWILLVTEAKSKLSDSSVFPAHIVNLPERNSIGFELECLSFTSISLVTSSQIKIQDPDIIISLRRTEELKLLAYNVYEVAECFKSEGISEYDWSKIRDLDFQDVYREKKELLKDLSLFHCQKCPDLIAHYSLKHQERQLQDQLTELEHNLSDLNLELLPDYHQRVDVLKALAFIDENQIVQIKGRVACEINTADELILTELILDNFFHDYEPAEIVALLSCFVFQEKSQSEPVLTTKLLQGVEKIKQVTTMVAQTQRSVGLDILVEDALGNLKFGLVEVVYEWARGLPFKHITDLTDVLEGSIVRCIVRLSETCREVSGAARLIGDTALYRKLEEASELIKRDIVFAASLYF